MKKHFIYITLILLLLPAFHTVAQSKQERWKALQESAQSIGLCLYMISMPDDQCKCMMDDGDGPYMTVLNRGWARTRMMGWMKKREQPISNALVIYDRGTNTIDGCDLNKGYFVVSPAELSPLEARPGAGNRYTFTFISNSGRAILNNTYWREFVSGREGRTLDRGTWAFNVMESDKAANFIKLFNEWLALYQ